MAPSDKPVAAMTSRDILDLPLERISIGPGRHRQDMGDLQALADSMSEIGLLQPIGVTADFALVFGERRLRAARNLGWTAILARIVDVPSIVAGEYAENEVRKDFTPSERVAIAEALRARIGERRGRPAVEKVACGPQISGKTRDLIAEKAGFSSGKEYERAKAVIEHGALSVVEAMDHGEVSISAAARAVKAAPKEEQANWTVADIRRAAKEAAIGPEPLPTPRKPVSARARPARWYSPPTATPRLRDTGPGPDARGLGHPPVQPPSRSSAPRSGRRDRLRPAHMRDWVTTRTADRLAWFERFTALWRERHAA